MEIEFIERTIGQKRSTDVACPDQGGIPGQIPPQDPPKILMEFSNVVPDPGMSELSDEGQVLSDLSIGQPEKRADLLRTHHRSIRGKKHHELPEVEAEAPGRRSGDVLLAVHVESLSRTYVIQCAHAHVGCHQTR